MTWTLIPMTWTPVPMSRLCHPISQTLVRPSLLFRLISLPQAPWSLPSLSRRMVLPLLDVQVPVSQAVLIMIHCHHPPDAFVWLVSRRC